MKNISSLMVIYSYILFAILFTNLFLLQYYLFTDSFSQLLQILLRDSVIYITIFALVLLVLFKKGKLLFKFEIILFTIIFIYILLGKYYSGNLGVSIKLMVTPILFILFGKYIAYFENPYKVSLNILNQIYILFALFLSVFMVVEFIVYVLSQKYIMLEIIQSFFNAKGFERFYILPASYKNSLIDFYRISSFVFDPVSVSFFFIYPAVYTFYKENYLFSFIFIISTLVSFSLIALYIVGLSILSIIVYKRKLKKALYFIFILFLLIFFGLLIGWVFFGFYIASFIGHYMALVVGLTKLLENIFGLGIGGSGYGGMFNSIADNLERNGDSLIAVFMSDFGVLGFLFIYYYIQQFKNLFNKNIDLIYIFPISIVYLNLILWSSLSSAVFLLNATSPLLVIVGYLSYKNKIIIKAKN